MLSGSAVVNSPTTMKSHALQAGITSLVVDNTELYSAAFQWFEAALYNEGGL